MRIGRTGFIAAGAAVIAVALSVGLIHKSNADWQEKFATNSCKFKTVGRSTYFVMEPGFQTVLQDGDTRLQITVLHETKTVDGVETRIIEEREWKNGALYEISRNFFAMCEATGDVFYFGEDVNFYKGNKVSGHGGSWLAGVKGARAGLIMAGTPKIGMKYYQEMAAGVAMDRAEIVETDGVCDTPAGRFERCLKVKEGSALEPWVTEYKYHAPGVGLIRDEDLRLVKVTEAVK